MKKSFFQQYLPQVAAGVTILFFGFQMLPHGDAALDWHYRDFGRLPVLDKGRIKPMDTVARNNLMVITHRQSYYDADSGQRYSANKWLLDVMTSPDSRDPVMGALCPNGAKNRYAWDYKVFRIENDELLQALGLKMRDGLRYSINEFGAKVGFIEDRAKAIDKTPAKERTLFDAKVLELAHHLHMIAEYSTAWFPLAIPDAEVAEPWHPFRTAVVDVFQARRAGDPVAPETEDAVETYLEVLRKYDQDDKPGFNAALTKYLAKLEKQSPAMMGKINLEVFFNEFAPFYQCLTIYVVLALVGAVSWLNTAWSTQLRRAAFGAMSVAFVVHTASIIIRIYLQGKPPVTNLYSSAIFIGWGCVGICMIAEWFYSNGIATVVGSVTGFCTLIIAHILSLEGDTMQMLVAVLDTNFWLATHVTCITLGYTTAFVAGFMGLAYIGLGMFTDKLRGEVATNLSRATYGVLCAGMFLSFVGTVLGGLWADYSWGRFWGWDPKENGALLIVIWIALILHARWGGMVKQRGMAVLSVIGIIVTSWSWFGTNFLGLGKHAYGGSQGEAMMWLVGLDLLILSIAGLGAWMPLQQWQSFRPPAKLDPPATPPPLSPTGIMATPTH
jgi:ABC-type transport system involved in cytochrome c biogenesis permease subunit